MDTLLVETIRINGGGTVQKKSRERLTVYLDEQLYRRFVEEAEQNYRSLSDHMNAIIAAHFEAVDAQSAASTISTENGGK